jgi:hypothetical protein
MFALPMGSMRFETRSSSSWVLDSHLTWRYPFDSPSTSRYRFTAHKAHSSQRSQSRQSAKLFLQSSELGLPHPLTRRRVCSPLLWCAPPLWFRGRGTLASGRGGEGTSQFQRGDRNCGNLGIYVPCAIVLSYSVQIPAEDPKEIFADPDPASRLEMRFRILSTVSLRKMH